MVRKLIAALVSAAVIFATSFTTALASGTPLVTFQLLGAIHSSSGVFNHTTTTQTGQRVVVHILIRDDASGTTINNGVLHLSLSGASSSPGVSGTFSAGNLTTPLSDSASFDLSGSTGVLKYVPGSTTITWNTGGAQNYQNVVLPDGIVSEDTTFDSPIQFGQSFEADLSFMADIVPASVTSSTSSTATNCDSTKPGSVNLSTPSRLSPTSVKLSWTKATNASLYVVSYGLAASSYQYGTTTSDTSSVISALDQNAKYYFSVLPVNGCTPGSKSNEVAIDPATLLFIAPAKHSTEGTVGGITTTQPMQEKGGNFTTNRVATSSSKPFSLSPLPTFSLPKVKLPDWQLPISTEAKVMILLGVLSLLGAGGLLLKSPPQPVKKGRGRPKKKA